MTPPPRTLPVLAAALAAAAPAATQSVQYRSPAGVEYRSQADTGPIARAESALAAEPRGVDRLIALGIAQSGARRYREAIATFTRGMALAPDDARLYRWRGHRYLSVRALDSARADLERAARLDSTLYGTWYHLGIVRFAGGDFGGAADAFARAQRGAPDADELAGATDWLWMALARAGRATEARAMLARRPDSLASTNAYARRLRLYRGEIGPDAVFTPADTGDIQVATLSYGLGNWHLVRGDTARARQAFARAIASGGWPAFGFIVAEIELRRLGGGGAPAPPAGDSASVTAAVDAFHAALAAGDSAAALRLLAPDVLVLEAGGLETLDEYRAHHLPADIAYAGRTPSTRTVRRVAVRGDVAWVVATSEAAAAAGAEMMVLGRGTGGWRIRAIHWSSRRRQAPRPSPDDLEAQVRAAETAFAATMTTRDSAAFATHIAADAVFFGRQGPQRGKAAVVEGWAPFFVGPTAPFSWAPDTVAVLESGTLALSSGPVFNPQGERVGTFNSVWRREADGRWRIVFDKGCPR